MKVNFEQEFYNELEKINTRMINGAFSFYEINKVSTKALYLWLIIELERAKHDCELAFHRSNEVVEIKKIFGFIPRKKCTGKLHSALSYKSNYYDNNIVANLMGQNLCKFWFQDYISNIKKEIEHLNSLRVDCILNDEKILSDDMKELIRDRLLDFYIKNNLLYGITSGFLSQELIDKVQNKL